MNCSILGEKLFCWPKNPRFPGPSNQIITCAGVISKPKLNINIDYRSKFFTRIVLATTPSGIASRNHFGENAKNAPGELCAAKPERQVSWFELPILSCGNFFRVD